MLELIGPFVTRGRQVHVGVYEGRHDGLAAEIDVGGACRNLYVRSSPGMRADTALDDEHRVLDRC